MKRILLLLNLAGFTGVFAQTLTVDDTIHIGDNTPYYVVDSSAVTLDATTGAGVTWDYSQIAGYNVAATNSSVVDASTSTWSSDFPDADYMEDFTNGLRTYFDNSTSEMTVRGFVFVNGTDEYLIKYSSDPLKSLEFPMNVGDTYTDAIAGTADSPQASGIAISGNATITADGGGTLKLGGTDFANVLRVKSVENLSGTVPIVGAVEVTRVGYHYYVPGTESLPVFRIDSLNISLGSLGEINYRTVHSSIEITDYVSTENLALVKDFSVYPNPASDFVRIDIGEQVDKISIYSMLGDEVYSDQKPASNLNLNITDYQTGVYFVELQNGATRKTKKLVVR